MGKKYTGRKSIRKKARSFKKTINRNKQKNGKTRRKTRRPKKLERQIEKKSRRIRRKVRRAKKKSRKASGKGGAPIDDDGDDDAYYELEEGKSIVDLKQLIKDTYTFDGDNNITGYKISEHLEPSEVIYQQQPRIGRAALKNLYERRSIKLPTGWRPRKDSEGTWQYIGSHETPRGRELV